MSPEPRDLIALVESGTVRSVAITPHDPDQTLVVIYGVAIPPGQGEAYDAAFRTLSGGLVTPGRSFTELDSDGCAPGKPDHSYSVMAVTYTAAAAAERMPFQAGAFRITA